MMDKVVDAQKTAAVLVVEPSVQTRSVLLQLLNSHNVVLASDAGSAIQMLELHPECKTVILDITLAAHSGFELLYELRTYADWDDVDIIIYTSIELQSEVLRSRAWSQLKIKNYFYKPHTNLQELLRVVEGSVSR